jgi:hypothetical protein
MMSEAKSPFKNILEIKGLKRVFREMKKMDIPNRAFREKILIKETLFGNGLNKIWYVHFVEDDEVKSGFFKKITPNYFPEHLAGISVAVSVFKKSFQGNQSSTEYLVFDENNKVSGILYLVPQNDTEQNSKDQIIETELMHWFLKSMNVNQNHCDLHEELDHTPFWNLTEPDLGHLPSVADPLTHEHTINAALKIILTYQPKVLYTRLIERLGDLSFNYSSLPPELRLIYEKEFPFLLNKKENNNSFVHFMMELYHQQYENLYNKVVYYMGAMHTELYRRPAFFQNILVWAQHENATTYLNAPKEQFNLIELKNRYHQIWRDSYASKFRIIHNAFIDLATDLCEGAYTKGKIIKQNNSREESLPWQSFCTLDNFLIQEQGVVNNEMLVKALKLLIHFCNEFQQILKDYYKKRYSELGDQDNYCFMMKLEQLCRHYEYDIGSFLIATQNQMTEFIRIVRELKRCMQQINFKIHLQNSKLSVKESSLYHCYETHRTILRRWVAYSDDGTIPFF